MSIYDNFQNRELLFQDPPPSAGQTLPALSAES